MTSNIGQEEFGERAAQIGFNMSESAEAKVLDDYAKAQERIKSSLSEYFSPEFLNRIDKIIVFRPLDKNAIKKIVKLQLEQFSSRLALQEIILHYDSKLIAAIAKNVYNPEFGAREVRRYITDQIEDKLAEMILLNSQKKEFTLSMGKEGILVK